MMKARQSREPLQDRSFKMSSSNVQNVQLSFRDLEFCVKACQGIVTYKSKNNNEEKLRERILLATFHHSSDSSSRAKFAKG